MKNKATFFVSVIFTIALAVGTVLVSSATPHPVDVVKFLTKDGIRSASIYVRGETVYCSDYDIERIAHCISATDLSLAGEKLEVDGSSPDFTVETSSGRIIRIGSGLDGNIRINGKYYKCSSNELSDILDGIYEKYYLAIRNNE
ncbi:MAG: hypothetical protein UIG59_06125 [Acutalibacteraceae bacterium]|nr:hypothetical protein [Acutalibacteraceae bacterium]